MPSVVTPPRGEPYEFEVAKGVFSALTCDEILGGSTYPVLPFVGDVEVVVDVGANCGAASVYFAQHYPEAAVHAVEPGSEQLEHLRRNVRGFPNVTVHPIGLHTEDKDVPLYHGKGDTGLASIVRNSWHRDSSEMISLRSADAWARETGLERIDLLKVDVELCEYDVLVGLQCWLPTVKAVYFEYGSRQLRRSIDRLLDATHDLYFGKMSLDQGECIYLRRDLGNAAGARERLWEIIAAGKRPPSMPA